MKGNASTHIPNDKYRESYDRIFGNKDIVPEWQEREFLRKQQQAITKQFDGFEKVCNSEKY